MHNHSAMGQLLWVLCLAPMGSVCPQTPPAETVDLGSGKRVELVRQRTKA